jgi:hypothetical protein
MSVGLYGAENQAKILENKLEIKNLARIFIKNINNNLFLDPDKYSSNETHLIGLSRIDTANLDKRFIKFYYIIEKRCSDINNSPLAVWYLLRNTAIEYFYRLFEKDNPSFPQNISTIDGYINYYMNINTINHDSIYNTAIFTYFLMNTLWKNNENNFIYYYKIVAKTISEFDQKNLLNFEKFLGMPINQSKINIADIELMSGKDFE